LFVEHHPSGEHQSVQQPNRSYRREKIFLWRQQQDIESLLCRKFKKQSSKSPKRVTDLQSAGQRPGRRLQATRSAFIERAETRHQDFHGFRGHETAQELAGVHPTTAYRIPKGTQTILDAIRYPGEFLIFF